MYNQSRKRFIATQFPSCHNVLLTAVGSCSSRHESFYDLVVGEM